MPQRSNGGLPWLLGRPHERGMLGVAETEGCMLHSHLRRILLPEERRCIGELGCGPKAGA